MSGKSDYTTEEWALLARAPFMTGMIVSLASPSGLTGVLGESMVVTKALLAAEGSTSTSALIKSLIADIKASRGALAKPSGLSPANAKTIAMEEIGKVSALLAQKATPEEAAAFKDWLEDIAQAAAEAATEGGLFGIGGVRVSESEKVAVEEVKKTLG
jgi:hypothetical protein